MSKTDILETEAKQLQEKIEELKNEIASMIVGQNKVIEELLLAVFAGGHALLEGLPGLGKTMLVRTLADAMNLNFSRIQFTPDLMPSDITGTKIIQPDEIGRQSFVFHEGPVFANIVLADEINRATPKTQSALLEAMQEKTVTVLGDVKTLDSPFFVLATQNPIELDGTYPLPEAQLDRFLIKINVDYPNREELKEIVKRTTGEAVPAIRPVMDANEVMRVTAMTRGLLVSDDVLDYAVQIIMSTHPDEADAPESIKQYVRYGIGPRGLQAIILLAKVKAFMSGRFHVAKADVDAIVKPALRHRLFMNFEGDVSGMTPDRLMDDVLHAVAEG
ncbi:MAG: AAA family ATPase [Tuberibacillus sp.]